MYNENYIELKSDGTYFVYQVNGETFGGDYEIEGGIVYLLLPLTSIEVQIEEDCIIDPDGGRWVKE